MYHIGEVRAAGEFREIKDRFASVFNVQFILLRYAVYDDRGPV